MSEATSDEVHRAVDAEGARERKFEKLSPFELKDELIGVADEAAKARAVAMLNAGRGNPNWIATTPREAFLLLGQFALDESRRTWDEPAVGLAGMASSLDIAARLRALLDEAPKSPGRDLLRRAVAFGVDELGFDADKFVWELVDAMNGDNYPVPDRMLWHNERIVRRFLEKEVLGGASARGLDLFAVEGGTAAMTSIFTSLFANGVLKKGDTIALGTPIFTPYLEIPHLPDFDLNVVAVEQSEVREDGRHAWQYPDSEIEKLLDRRVKAFFVVNPANPSAVAIKRASVERLVDIVRMKRPDLILLTDDVYATFVDGFRSLAADLPHNTILVYSWSKHFGATGWRLGVVAMHEQNVVDEIIGNLPAREQKRLDERYGALTLEPRKLKFIDRMVADSRLVALNHTAGLSLPQQLQMSLFSLFALLDENDAYRERCKSICRERLSALAGGLGIELHDDELRSAYYQTLDLKAWIDKNIGEDVMRFVEDHLDPVDLVFALARRGVVLLPGSGFHGPSWSVRVSLANLSTDTYAQIGRVVRDLVEQAVRRFEASRASPSP